MYAMYAIYVHAMAVKSQDHNATMVIERNCFFHAHPQGTSVIRMLGDIRKNEAITIFIHKLELLIDQLAH